MFVRFRGFLGFAIRERSSLLYAMSCARPRVHCTPCTMAIRDAHIPMCVPIASPLRSAGPRSSYRRLPAVASRLCDKDPTVISVTQECPIRTDAASEATRDLYVSTVPSSTD